MAQTAPGVSTEQLEHASQCGLPATLRLHLNSFFDRCFGRGVDLWLVLIPAGEFQMGSPDDEPEREDCEGPVHTVRITQPFYMGIHEVTQAQYEEIMRENSSHFKGKNLPVDSVPWTDAAKFCEMMSQATEQEVRLPTEAEWEYACRAGTTTPFHLGPTISTREANYDGNHVYASGRRGRYKKTTMPVGSFNPNPWGLYEMHGNVLEWCQDWFYKHYYDHSPIHDPKGPKKGKNRIHRGGSWFNSPAQLRCAARGYFKPTFALWYHGFRVVMTAPRSGK